MAVANTLEQLKREHGSDIEHTRSYSMNPDLLVEEEGFNVRDYDDPETIEHINQLAEAYKAGSWVPPLVVKTVDGKPLVRDGHCRLRAIKKARKEGAEIRRVDVIEYQGDDVDQITLLLTSNAGKDLKPLERATVYQRLRNHGLTDDEIAERVQHTPQHVRQMLALTSLPSDIKAQVNQGIIAPTYAMELYQKHGKKASKIIDKAYQRMMSKIAPEKRDEEAGKLKVTRKHVTKQRRLPPSVLTSLRGTMSNLAPILANIEIDEGQDAVSFSIDRDLFLQLREDAEKVKSANDKAEKEAEALEQEAAEAEKASEHQAEQARAEPVSAEPENAAIEEMVSASEGSDTAESEESEEPLLHEPAMAAMGTEEENDDEFTLSSDKDILNNLSRLKRMTEKTTEEEDGYAIVKDEDEEVLGMHNTPDF